jgi:hypothetical protein
MAIDPKDLTIDYRKIQSMPFRDRKALVYSSFADQVNSALTPSQRANLFPNYYVKSATSGATPGAGGDPNLSKADYLNRARNGGVSDSDLNRVSGRPEDRGPPQITASEFRAVESNPFLAGYVDKTRRVETSNSKFGRFSPRERATLDFISAREGSKNPDIIFGDSGNKPGSGRYSRALGLDKRPLSDHSIAEVIALQKKLTAITGADGVAGGVGTSAVGTGQMIRGTLIGNLRSLGIPEEDWDKIKFDETLQNRLTLENFKTSGIGDPNGDPRQWNHTTLGRQYESLDTSKGFNAMSGDEMYSIIKASSERPKEVDEQTATPDAMAVVDKVMSETPSAVELKMSAENLDINSTPESALAFLNNKERNPDGANLGDVDARLLELAEMGIRKFESENSNFKVEIYGPSSGKRQSSVTQNSQHLVGKALDFEIFEVDPKTGQKTGKRLPNFRTQAGAGEAGDEYLNLHQNIELARIYKKEVIKDQRYEGVYGRSGALFGGEYALDTQHYDIGGAPAADGIMSASQPGGSIFGGYSEEYMRRFGVESAAMPIQQDKVVELAKSTYGPKETETAVATTSSTPTSAVPAVTTVAPAQGVTTSGVTTAAAPPAPESTNYPIKTMAQGGIIPKSADTQIVQRNMSGDIISATKVGENENERMNIEPISKMSADALTVGSYNPVEGGMNDSKSQSALEDKKVSMKSQSVAQPRLSSDPYSNIQGDIKPMSPTARAAMMAARDLSTQRRGYSL